MPVQDDFSVAVNGDIRYTGGATIRYELRWKHFANEWAWESIATNLDSTTGTYTQSATIAWTPGTDDRGNVITNIEICSGSALCTAFQLVGTTNGSIYTITGLSPSTIYRVRIKYSDPAGNVSANYSDRATFTTATTGIILPRAPVSFGQPRAPRQ
mgnify:CR=1 FL=1